MTYKVGDKVVFIGDHTFGPANWRQSADEYDQIMAAQAIYEEISK